VGVEVGGGSGSGGSGGGRGGGGGESGRIPGKSQSITVGILGIGYPLTSCVVSVSPTGAAFAASASISRNPFTNIDLPLPDGPTKATLYLFIASIPYLFLACTVN
jgi:hypothetical protein